MSLSGRFGKKQASDRKSRRFLIKLSGQELSCHAYIILCTDLCIASKFIFYDGGASLLYA